MNATAKTAQTAQKGSWVSAFKKILFSLGPGIITAALVFGPSKITVTSKLGAEYGYSLLWIVFIAIFFMTVFTIMGARIGLATNQSLLATIRQKWGNWAAVTVGIGIFLVAASFQAGNSIGVGIAVGEFTGTSPVIWIVVFNLIGISLLSSRSFYKILQNMMLCLVTVILFAFITTLFFARPDVSQVARGFVIPTLPAGSQGLVIAFFASCFSIVAAFYQAYLVQERVRVNPEAKSNKNHSITGMIVLGLMSAIVMICGAAVLHKQGIKVNSATDMARALEPLFGNYASKLFLIGLFGASFSPLIGNATLGGVLLGDALGYGSKLSSKAVRLLIALVMVTGAAVAIAFGKLPIELIIFAQSVTIFLVPFIGYTMYAIANDKKIMGPHVSPLSAKILGGIGLLILLLLAVSNVKELFFK